MDSTNTKLDGTEPRLMRWVALITSKGKIRIILVSVLLIALIGIVDSQLEPSLGVFYIVPMILGATVLSISEITLMAVVCAVLRGLFDHPLQFLNISWALSLLQPPALIEGFSAITERRVEPSSPRQSQ